MYTYIYIYTYLHIYKFHSTSGVSLYEWSFTLQVDFDPTPPPRSGHLNCRQVLINLTPKRHTPRRA